MREKKPQTRTKQKAEATKRQSVEKAAHTRKGNRKSVKGGQRKRERWWW